MRRSSCWLVLALFALSLVQPVDGLRATAPAEPRPEASADPRSPHSEHHDHGAARRGPSRCTCDHQANPHQNGAACPHHGQSSICSLAAGADGPRVPLQLETGSGVKPAVPCHLTGSIELDERGLVSLRPVLASGPVPSGPPDPPPESS